MKTDDCYIVLSCEVFKGIILKSEKIYGYHSIMSVGHRRDQYNRIANYTHGVAPLNIDERNGFNSFQELEDMYKLENDKE